MGFWNDGFRAPSPPRNRSRSRTRTSTSRNEKTIPDYYASRPSYSRSASSLFSSMTGSGTPRGRSHSSRARPRDGFMAKLRKFVRDLYMYMRRHPVKVFFLVIMPLITGGALTKILSQFGIRLPKSLERMAGSSQFRGYGENERYYARGGARDIGGGSALPGIGESVQSAFNIAKMFM